MSSWLIGWIILFIILFIIVIITAIWWLSNNVLFQPQRAIIDYPKIPYEDLYLPVGSIDGVSYSSLNRPQTPCLNVWHFASFPGKEVILFLHGNSGNISYQNFIIDTCRSLQLNLLLVDYQGYGKSDGSPGARKITQDATTAYYFLIGRYSPDKIIIWGESMGGAAAIYLASLYPCRCLIILSTFSSLDDVAFYYTAPSWITYPIGYAIKYLVDPIPSKEWITQITCPVAIIHSDDDDIISIKNGEILYECVPHSRKTLIRIKGPHSHPRIDEKCLMNILQFAGVNTQICPDYDMNTIGNYLHALGSQ